VGGKEEGNSRKRHVGMQKESGEKRVIREEGR
jgi:hypothetical protein